MLLNKFTTATNSYSSSSVQEATAGVKSFTSPACLNVLSLFLVGCKDDTLVKTTLYRGFRLACSSFLNDCTSTAEQSPSNTELRNQVTKLLKTVLGTESSLQHIANALCHRGRLNIFKCHDGCLHEDICTSSLIQSELEIALAIFNATDSICTSFSNIIALASKTDDLAGLPSLLLSISRGLIRCLASAIAEISHETESLLVKNCDEKEGSENSCELVMPQLKLPLVPILCDDKILDKWKVPRRSLIGHYTAMVGSEIKAGRQQLDFDVALRVDRNKSQTCIQIMFTRERKSIGYVLLDFCFYSKGEKQRVRDRTTTAGAQKCLVLRGLRVEDRMRGTLCML